ncbi:MAG: gliding motility-associated C-terminal domain-containing protein [Bacteroidales bacterium]
MKKSIFLLFVGIMIIAPFLLEAQTGIRLNNQNHEKTFYNCSTYVFDSGGDLFGYETSSYIWTAFCPSDSNTRIALTFDQFDIHPSDSIEIYSGVGLGGNIHFKEENKPFFTNNDLLGKTIIAYPTDTSGCLTIHLKSGKKDIAQGFKAKIECLSFCQFPVAALDTFFYKFNLDGTKTPFPIKSLTETIVDLSDSSKNEIINYKAIDICHGDSIQIVTKTIFPENNLSYHQSEENLIYYWDFGDLKVDSVYFSNSVNYKWAEVNGYDLMLTVEDTLHGGCQNRNSIDARVRIAANPIKTVSPIPDLCSGEVFRFNVGYSANNTIKIDSIKYVTKAKMMNAETVFIPDGPACGIGTQCYYSPITFDQFRPNSKITSAQDIKSICLNIEHSYLGDIDMSIVCPNGQVAFLKSYSTNGGNKFLGIPAGGNSFSSFDYTNPCAAPPNIEGIGSTYCFSESYSYSGQLGSSSPVTNVSFNVPAWTANPTGTVSSVMPTNVSDSSGYFLPSDPFSDLIDCPLNGTWNIKVCDYLSRDNGFVFWWELELDQNGKNSWEYQVPIDKVILDGPFIIEHSDTSLFIAPPIEDCGFFKYDIHIIDDFQCIWDTLATLNVVCTPVVDLGDDIEICEKGEITLDAGNPDAFEHLWEPHGETTQTITAKTEENSNPTIIYIAQVTNTNGSLYCFGKDSINLIVRPSALAAFYSDKSHLEGCEPFNFQLFSTSTNADSIIWTLGQERKNITNPTFSLPYGTYDLRLKVVSKFGCQDSIFQPNLINVYKSPIADFGWQPTYPSSTNPKVNFLNLSSPQDPANIYLWKIQNNKTNDLRENIMGLEPNYSWQEITGTSLVGDYKITLDAYSSNLAPSGLTYECHDTISKVISIINDKLLFPNVITPNGDGVNDVLIIINLIEGQAYPDNELSIYNRNGKRIFFKQDIRANHEIWDPKETNTPDGTYFYRFVGKGPIRSVEYNGTIEILR